MSWAGAPLDCPSPTLHPGLVGVRRVDVTDQPPSLTVVLVPSDALVQAPWLLDARAYALTGGARMHPHITRVDPVPGRSDEVLLTLDMAGDFSVYTLTIAGPGVDPFFGGARFRFRLGCEGDFDCRPGLPPGAPAPRSEVAIDYLAKDYASFRQALLDFVPTRLPGWTERSEADVGMMLLELLAATGDTLSYVQDRVANEAYLATATQRRSVQGHLDLVGYQMDEGAAAYAWLAFQVNAEHRLPARFQVATSPQPGETDAIFETLAPALLQPEQNSLQIYDWGNRLAGTSGCCLPAGSTSTYLVGDLQTLQTGSRLLFRTMDGRASDLVTISQPPTIARAQGGHGYGYAGTPAVTQIRWSAAQALRHDYCIDDTVVLGNLVLAVHGRTVTDTPSIPGMESLVPSEDAVVVPPTGPAGTQFRIDAFGFAAEEKIAQVVTPPGQKPSGAVILEQTETGGVSGVPIESAASVPGVWQVDFAGTSSAATAHARWMVGRIAAGSRPRLRIPLAQGPLAWVDTEVIALAGTSAPASSAISGYRPRSLPQVELKVNGAPWQVVRTLLQSGAGDDVYRLETSDDGDSTLVFGQGGEPSAGQEAFGRRPPDGAKLEIKYRIGGGSAGNVGADTLTAALGMTDPSWFRSVTNPIAAAGGREPETRDHAIRLGPSLIENRLVAVTSQDYKDIANAFVDESGAKPIARTDSTYAWTGSWLTVKLTTETASGADLDPRSEATLLTYLENRRLAGYDLEVTRATYAPLQLDVDACALPGHLATDVKRNLEQALGAGVLRDGSPAVFNPINFTFGQRVDVSRLFAAAMAVPGVRSMTIKRLARLHSPTPDLETQLALRNGYLPIGPGLVARMDSDPNFPERGRLTVTVEGGL